MLVALLEDKHINPVLVLVDIYFLCLYSSSCLFSLLVLDPLTHNIYTYNYACRYCCRWSSYVYMHVCEVINLVAGAIRQEIYV